jgi:hypothetical protein
MERDGGGSIVAALKPTAAFTLVDNPEVMPIAEDVEARMRRVLERLGEGVGGGYEVKGLRGEEVKR